jgi:hypothetical protein
LEDPGVDRRMILKCIFREWDLDWIAVAQERGRWLALVNAVMNFRVPYKVGDFFEYLRTI